MKVKNAEIMGTDLEIKKPPRVMLKTEEVERELTAIVERPNGIAGTPPDFQAMRQRVLAALTDKPFDSTRTIPEVDTRCHRRGQADRERRVYAGGDCGNHATAPRRRRACVAASVALETELFAADHGIVILDVSSRQACCEGSP